MDDQNFEEQDPNNFDLDWELETLKYSTLSFCYQANLIAKELRPE